MSNHYGVNPVPELGLQPIGSFGGGGDGGVGTLGVGGSRRSGKYLGGGS